MNINITLFGQIITFGVFVWFCMKYVWPPLLQIMEARRQAIQARFDRAAQADQSLKQAEADKAACLLEASRQAELLIEQAKQQANNIIHDAQVQAKASAERIREAEEIRLEQDRQRVQDELRKNLGKLVLLGAEKVSDSTVNAQTHDKLVQQLASQL